MRLTVAKFGGTSMGNAQAITQVADILQKSSVPIVAVVSATSGTTDALIKLGQEALNNGPWKEILQQLIDKHQIIIKELAVEVSLDSYFEEIHNMLVGVSMIMELSLSTMDRLMSFGERMSSQILTALLKKRNLKSEAIDAYDLIAADNNFSEGNVDFESTDQKIQEIVGPLVKKGIIPVITGFVGKAANGQYITLGRGGSDYSGAIIAAGLHATDLEIWTDVDGIYQADPRVIPGARLLEKLSFHEASELAYFGAKVLHPKTIKPAVNQNIPVKILNTFNTSAKGTLITNDESDSIKSVTCKKNICIINICSTGMLNAHGFLSKIFEVFARHKVIVDVVATSEVNVSLTVDNGFNQAIIPELEKFAMVQVSEDMSIICLVGSGIRTNSKILGQLFSSLADYNVSMVSQGSSKRNITFLVNGKDTQEVVVKAFNTFFNHS